MDQLFELYFQKIRETSLDFIRPMISVLEDEEGLLGIKGPRGVGKTTLLLQFLKQIDTEQKGEYLYASLDNIWFLNNKVYDLADMFVKRGGKFLALDEVHKYPNWSQELKNIHDDFTKLKVVFTGSSLLQILNARADLSRRAVVYDMQGLSFREYLILETGIHFPEFNLNQILKTHIECSSSVLEKIKPFVHFQTYLKHGYYPFYLQSKKNYHAKLDAVINMILEIELPMLRQTDISYARKMKQLLLILAESSPFVPNLTKMAERIGINRKTLLLYIHYLEEAKLIISVHKDSKGITRLQKPDKILPDNTNLSLLLSPSSDIGSLRETFFSNQLSYKHQITYPEKGVFLIDDQFLFEIVGKSKSAKQIEGTANAFRVLDEIEFGNNNTIPLWLFGFLY